MINDIVSNYNYDQTELLDCWLIIQMLSKVVYVYANVAMYIVHIAKPDL